MGKPGVMFYFEVRPCLNRLTREEKGDLFEAILDYGQYGVLPELEGATGVAWDFLQPKLDRDNDRYGRVSLKKTYAAYAKYANTRGEPALSYEQWEKQQTEAVTSGCTQKTASASICTEETASASICTEETAYASICTEETASASMCTEETASASMCTEETAFASICTEETAYASQTSNPKLQTTNSKPQTTNSKPQAPNAKPQTAALEPSATPSVFSPPSRQEILAYCREKGYRLDADSFLDYYTANGWKVGRSPMKNWQAAVRRWCRKEDADGKTSVPATWSIGTKI